MGRVSQCSRVVKCPQTDVSVSCGTTDITQLFTRVFSRGPTSWFNRCEGGKGPQEWFTGVPTEAPLPCPSPQTCWQSLWNQGPRLSWGYRLQGALVGGAQKLPPSAPLWWVSLPPRTLLRSPPEQGPFQSRGANGPRSPLAYLCSGQVRPSWAQD